MTVPEQAIKLIKIALSHLNPKIIVGTNGFNIEFSISGTDYANNIVEALKAMAKLLAKRKTKAILFY
jgi:hypothetical protein